MSAPQRRQVSEATLKMIADRFKVMGEFARLKILHELWDGERTVSELIAASGLLQANISKHLGLLQQAGLVTRRKEGLRVHYRICDETVFQLCELVCSSIHDRLTSQIQELHPALRSRMRAKG